MRSALSFLEKGSRASSRPKETTGRPPRRTLRNHLHGPSASPAAISPRPRNVSVCTGSLSILGRRPHFIAAALSLGMARAPDGRPQLPKNRKQFGKAQSANFRPSVQTCRHGHRQSKRRASSYTRPRGHADQNSFPLHPRIIMAKLFASEVAVRVCQRMRTNSRRLRFQSRTNPPKSFTRRQTLHDRRRHQRNSKFVISPSFLGKR